MTAKRRNKTDQRKIKAEIRARLANGLTDEEIVEEVGLSPNIYVGYKRQVLHDELNEAVSDSAGETWARYSLLMSGCLRDLNTVIRQGHSVFEERGDTRSMNAVVGAIKAKAQKAKKRWTYRVVSRAKGGLAPGVSQEFVIRVKKR